MPEKMYLCLHCHREKDDHKAGTFNCPLSRKAFTHYHRDNTYTPNHKKPVKEPKFYI